MRVDIHTAMTVYATFNLAAFDVDNVYVAGMFLIQELKLRQTQSIVVVRSQVLLHDHCEE